MITLTPASTKPVAIMVPIPLPPPVTTARLPAMSNSSDALMGANLGGPAGS